jgi:hypothetical protein
MPKPEKTDGVEIVAYADIVLQPDGQEDSS